MRSKLIAISFAILVHFASMAGAQTPTPTFTVPTPTVTPPPHIYLSDPTLANSYTSSNQRRASVAVGADGNYLIVWNSDAAQLGYYDIKGQLFTRDGVKIGGEFQVDQAGATRVEYTPDVAADGAGNYVVVWADFNQTVTDSEVFMRRYDGAANPLAGAVQVNSYTTAKQRLPRVAADPIGQFVVVWESENQDGSGLGVFGQQFDAAGAPVGVEFAVNAYTTGNQDRPAVDMDAEGFTVVFNDGNSGVAARDFGAFPPPGVDTPIFGANHTQADVKRYTSIVDGSSNTVFVAENPDTGAIDARRRRNGSFFPVFAALREEARTAQSARLWRSRDLKTIGLAAHNYHAPTDSYHVVAQQWEEWAGGLRERGEKVIIFEDSTDPWIPACAGSDHTGQVVFAGQGAAPGGQGHEVWRRSGGHPDALNVVFGDGSVRWIKQDVSYQTQLRLVNGGLPESLSGTLAIPADGLVGNSPASVLINDATADYGMVPSGGTTDCGTTGDCYNITIQGPRPGLHWDEAVTETLNTGASKTWLLHVGGSFGDVPDTNPFIEFIETLLHNGITAGGACGGYCPTDGVKRQQMAVFLLKSRYGPSFTPPPATGTIFTDVTLANPFAAWIEALFLLGITGGCSGGPPPAPTQFCPDAIVNRQQMAVFLLKTLEGSAYTPPDAAGIFQDVPLSNPFVKWIEELYARQVTGGCVASPLQYCPTNSTNRQQMAAFLTKTFGLQLYGP